jgi:hypothetical protein
MAPYLLNRQQQIWRRPLRLLLVPFHLCLDNVLDDVSDGESEQDGRLDTDVDGRPDGCQITGHSFVGIQDAS